MKKIYVVGGFVGLCCLLIFASSRSPVNSPTVTTPNNQFAVDSKVAEARSPSVRASSDRDVYFTDPLQELLDAYATYADDLIRVRALADEFCKKTGKKPGMQHIAVCLTGSVEAEMLYLRLRVIKPELVMEMSTAVGYTTMWILQALEDNNKGKLVGFDLVATDFPVVLPESARARYIFHEGDARAHLEKYNNTKFDYLHIDTGHDEPFIRWYLRNLVEKFAYDNHVTYVSMHDVVSNIDPAHILLAGRADFPSVEGLFILTWMAYSGVARDVYTVGANTKFANALHTQRVKLFGEAEANRVVGDAGHVWGGKNYASTMYFRMDRAPAICPDCLGDMFR